ncbi:putative lysophospholipase SPAC1A6.03c, partial [Lachnellula suecica]
MLSPVFLSLLVSAASATLYTPISTTCPSTSLVRAASGLSDNEEAYRVSRKAVADEALKAWLTSTDSGFGTAELPTVALTTSGGGYRSMLSGAGVIQGLDSRDSNVSTSGLFQALTYQAGLSGGSWLLTSISGNNYPTVSNLRDTLWEQALQDSLFDPGELWAAVNDIRIVDDIASKEAAGFDTTLTDPWGRLLGYQFYKQDDGGAGVTWSSVTTFSNFTSHAVPYPVITALGVKVWEGQCLPGPNATTYEFTPYEFGSWDSDVSAFTPTEYLGTSLKGGVPTSALCTTNYDNIGYITGTSSNLFSELCTDLPAPANSSTDVAATLEAVLDKIHE